MQRISAGLACWHTNPGGIKEVYPHYVYTGSYIRPVYRDNNPYAGDNNHKIPFAPVVNNTSGSIVGYKYLNMSAVPQDKPLQMQLRLKAEDTDGRIRIMLGSPWTTKRRCRDRTCECEGWQHFAGSSMLRSLFRQSCIRESSRSSLSSNQRPKASPSVSFMISSCWHAYKSLYLWRRILIL